MTSMSLYQKFFYRGLCVSGVLALASFVLLIIIRLAFPVFGMGLYIMYAPLTLLQGSSVAVVAFCLAMLTQNRPLHHHSSAVNALSIAGITLVALGACYVIMLYGLTFMGVHTSTPFWALASYWVKNVIIFGTLLMYSAFAFSYKPLRLPAVRLIGVICAITACAFTALSLNDYSVPAIYEPFALLFGIGAFVAVIATINLAKDKDVEAS